jgi:hypothetical protein
MNILNLIFFIKGFESKRMLKMCDNGLPTGALFSGESKEYFNIEILPPINDSLQIQLELILAQKLQVEQLADMLLACQIDEFGFDDPEVIKKEKENEKSLKIKMNQNTVQIKQYHEIPEEISSIGAAVLAKTNDEDVSISIKRNQVRLSLKMSTTEETMMKLQPEDRSVQLKQQLNWIIGENEYQQKNAFICRKGFPLKRDSFRF